MYIYAFDLWFSSAFMPSTCGLVVRLCLRPVVWVVYLCPRHGWVINVLLSETGSLSHIYSTTLIGQVLGCISCIPQLHEKNLRAAPEKNRAGVGNVHIIFRNCGGSFHTFKFILQTARTECALYKLHQWKDQLPVITMATKMSYIWAKD